MATDQDFVHLYTKQILPVDQFKLNFLDYLRTVQENGQAQTFDRPQVLRTLINLGTVGNNANIGTASVAYSAVTGLGRTIKFTGPDSRTQGIKIPMSDGTYKFALESVLLENGVEVNPRDGKVYYRKFTESIGRKTTPSSVVDNGDGTLTFVVDSLFEAGNDSSGRSVKVYLRPRDDGGSVGPQSATESVAIETRTVAFASGSNKITTVGKLGQAAASTTAADYYVVSVGPTVKRTSQEDLATTPGAVLIGQIVRSGGVLGAIDLSIQSVLTMTLADMQDVLSRDGHGFVKVRVKADASDSGQSQISVQNSSGVTKFSVDEAGNTHIYGNLVVDGTEQITLTETVLGDLVIGDSSGDTMTVHATATFDGDLRTISGNVVATAAPLTFKDSVSGTAIPLRESAVPTLGTFRQSLLGGFEDLRVVQYQTTPSYVSSGLGVTAGASNHILIAAGQAFFSDGTNKGRLVTSAGAGATALADGTWYVALTDTAVLDLQTTPDNGNNASHVPLAKVVVTAGTVSSITDLRCFPQGERTILTVGDTASHFNNFATLQAAVDHAAHRASGMGTSNQNANAYEIWIMGQTADISSVVFIPSTLSGLKIKGCARERPADLRWTSSGDCLNIIANYVTIEDIRFVYAGGSDSSTAHAIRANTGGSGTGLIIQRCSFATAGFRCGNVVDLATLNAANQAVIRDCYFADPSANGSMIHVVGNDVLIQRCRFETTQATATGVVGSGKKLTIQNSTFDGFTLNEVQLSGATYARILNNVFQNGSTGANYSIALDSSSADALVSDNSVNNHAKPFIQTAATGTTISNNHLDYTAVTVPTVTVGTASAPGAIEVTGAKCSVTGNYVDTPVTAASARTDGFGAIHASGNGANGFLAANNHVIGGGAWPIYASGATAAIQNNRIEGWHSTAGILASPANAAGPTIVSGNRIVQTAYNIGGSNQARFGINVQAQVAGSQIIVSNNHIVGFGNTATLVGIMTSGSTGAVINGNVIDLNGCSSAFGVHSAGVSSNTGGSVICGNSVNNGSYNGSVASGGSVTGDTSAVGYELSSTGGVDANRAITFNGNAWYTNVSATGLKVTTRNVSAVGNAFTDADPSAPGWMMDIQGNNGAYVGNSFFPTSAGNGIRFSGGDNNIFQLNSYGGTGLSVVGATNFRKAANATDNNF